jgi:hypothetical protein
MLVSYFKLVRVSLLQDLPLWVEQSLSLHRGTRRTGEPVHPSEQSLVHHWQSDAAGFWDRTDVSWHLCFSKFRAHTFVSQICSLLSLFRNYQYGSSSWNRWTEYWIIPQMADTGCAPSHLCLQSFLPLPSRAWDVSCASSLFVWYLMRASIHFHHWHFCWIMCC